MIHWSAATFRRPVRMVSCSKAELFSFVSPSAKFTADFVHPTLSVFCCGRIPEWLEDWWSAFLLLCWKTARLLWKGNRILLRRWAKCTAAACFPCRDRLHMQRQTRQRKRAFNCRELTAQYACIVTAAFQPVDPFNTLCEYYYKA